MYLFGCQSGERRGAQDQDEALVLISKSVAGPLDDALALTEQPTSYLVRLSPPARQKIP
jgi:hypothetical protein